MIGATLQWIAEKVFSVLPSGEDQDKRDYLSRQMINECKNAFTRLSPMNNGDFSASYFREEAPNAG
ncbi:MAG: hypothetical protein ACYC9K_03745 [Sulfuricaulis sp.]